ncbi:MAG: TIGR02757 family protein [Spirochaetaceae bacterium]|nr:MAG: TIGR02757 family protein [Spirochaetaceae bacterium]
MNALGHTLESVYERFHRREFISPDPLEVVWEYPEGPEREVAALVCALFALGRVRSIVSVCRNVLSRIGPLDGLVDLPDDAIRTRLDGFVYRFFSAEETSRFFCSLRDLLREFGSLDRACASGLQNSSHAGMPPARKALVFLSNRLRHGRLPLTSILVPDAEGPSASKRLHLFLRWMVRKDEVDPGGFTSLTPSDLLVPVDVHMHRTARILGLTARKSADAIASEEITDRFRLFCPDDPVRYDFSLTRFGIHPDGPAASAEFFDTHA